MSVASKKNTLALWRAWLHYRHYGTRKASDFSFRERFAYAATSLGTRIFLRLCTDTCRWTFEGDEWFAVDKAAARRNFIFLMWHNRVPGHMAYEEMFARLNPSYRMDSIVSASKDGEHLARPIREMGGGEIRGSSSRDASKALRAGIKAARAGANIATVGDGPRGPRYRLKPGPILLAKATGLQIIPVTWSCTRVVQLHRSWDQLMVPLPTAHLHFRFADPISVARTADSDEVTRIRDETEEVLMKLTEWADTNTHVRWQFPKPKPGEVLKRRTEQDLEGRHVN